MVFYMVVGPKKVADLDLKLETHYLSTPPKFSRENFPAQKHTKATNCLVEGPKQVQSANVPISHRRKHLPDEWRWIHWPVPVYRGHVRHHKKVWSFDFKGETILDLQIPDVCRHALPVRFPIIGIQSTPNNKAFDKSWFTTQQPRFEGFIDHG